jgi:hypothetical protein
MRSSPPAPPLPSQIVLRTLLSEQSSQLEGCTLALASNVLLGLLGLLACRAQEARLRKRFLAARAAAG